MTEQQYNKAKKLHNKIEVIQEELCDLEIIQKNPIFYISDKEHGWCTVPLVIANEVYKLIKTEYNREIEDWKKELEEL